MKRNKKTSWIEGLKTRMPVQYRFGDGRQITENRSVREYAFKFPYQLDNQFMFTNIVGVCRRPANPPDPSETH
jgi:hypothetical protein